MATAKKLGQFVLENKNGQTIRTFQGLDEKLILVRRLDTGRVEAHDSLEALNEAEVEFEVLLETTASQIKKSPIALDSIDARIAYLDEVEETDKRIELEADDSQHDFIVAGKWVVGANVALLVLSLAFNLIFKSDEEMKETQVVQIVMPEIAKKEVRKTVEMSEKKIDKQVKHVQKVKKIVQTKQNRNLRATSFGRTKTNKVATGGQNINQVGALAVLGGKSNAPITGGSLNLKNVQFKNGSGGGGTGAAGRGGMGGAGRGGFANAMAGQGLLSASRGTGALGAPSGGYGTRGRAGGQNGYGRANLTGGSDGYFQPLEQDAEVSGGLDRDQIAEVIQKNYGQIMYCFERGLQTQPKLSGRVGMKWVINGSGRVSSARVGNSSLRSSSVEGCLVAKLRGFQFPRPVGGVNVSVDFPFNFQRVSQR